MFLQNNLTAETKDLLYDENRKYKYKYISSYVYIHVYVSLSL